MTRSYVRSRKEERAVSIEPFNSGMKMIVISLLSQTGVEATMSIEEAVNTEVFDAYVEYFHISILRKGNIVLLDNVKFHYSW